MKYIRQSAPFMGEYIGIMHDELESSGDNLWIYGYPYNAIDSYLRPQLIILYKDLFDKAEQAVEESPEILPMITG